MTDREMVDVELVEAGVYAIPGTDWFIVKTAHLRSGPLGGSYPGWELATRERSGHAPPYQWTWHLDDPNDAVDTLREARELAVDYLPVREARR